jgi:hypothetical protein
MYITLAESARKIRAALRPAFPQTNITVKSRSGFNSVEIEWDDSGPTVAELQQALSTAKLTESVERWPGREDLQINGHYLIFDCFNRARREAAQRDAERKKQEAADLRQREYEAVQEAYKAKRAAQPKSSGEYYTRSPYDPAIDEAFERLRQKAEAQVAEHEGDRRPSWAPPLFLGDELAEACRALDYLAADDKPIGRLWAQFATPKRSGRYLRENVSQHPLHGIAVRGYQLFASGERQSRAEMLFEAQRRDDGKWQFGPWRSSNAYISPRAREWEELIRKRVQIDHNVVMPKEWVDANRAAVTAQIEALDAQDTIDAKRHDERQRLRNRALGLARARVLDFIGAPDAEMQLAGRLWGHCCRCGKGLIDPLSLERGIGPDCHQRILTRIETLANDGRPLEVIAWLAGMSVDFVNTVLSEAGYGSNTSTVQERTATTVCP